MKIIDLMMLLSSIGKLKNKEKNTKDVDLKFSYSVKTDKDCIIKIILKSETIKMKKGARCKKV